MITTIDDLPAGVIGFRAEGEIDEEEMRALGPVLREAAAAGDARALFIAAADFDSGTARSVLRRFDQVLGDDLGEPSDWTRVAIVIDSRMARHSHRVWGRLIPLETKVFASHEETIARAWLSED